MARRPSTLRRQLLLWLLIPLLILFAIRTVHTYFISIDQARRVYDRTLVKIAHSLANQLRYDSTLQRAEPTPTAREILLADDVDWMDYVVYDAQGRVLGGNAALPLIDSVKASDETLHADILVNGEPVRMILLQRPALEEYPGQRLFVGVAETLNKRDLLAREIMTGALIPQALIIIFATLVVWFGVGKGLSVLRTAQRAVSQRSHTDLSPLHVAGAPQEVEPLIGAINELLARIDSMVSAQNRFIADSAHQLRTPVAGLVAQVEYAKRQDDPALLRETLAQFEVIGKRLTRLINQLLALARTDTRETHTMRMAQVDLVRLVGDAARDWVPQALDRDIDLGYEGPETPVYVMGDGARLKDMVDNLIDNAIRYTQSGGQVTARVQETPTPRIVVEDNGPGIPAEEREQIFERFYRVLGTGMDGSGLGLAIVREIAGAHNADLRLADNPQGSGAQFTVAFNPGTI